ncbi:MULTISPECIES: serine hydrolase domain-containing protein [unclassified Shewanella]|uniref:serine hydrolase domain-containing protein n=1 Tax=unclassified Shewanella TaxID=196818 RepID=UPI000C8493B9|nr:MULTISPECIES: serine hydrolase domain-containing protein [unclassified Shewanella]MDO6620098.1 serine hydrolase domain-containing protein [Shewanella sp. 6_MG-2023]MDO6640508.1 serine hydrolase domain-containing protein [Shewanella sp. 5_MG-2023]MDO6678841.1 serine hydrolase domain-containing protein [Shewanella sp. 4_MG-2023]PMG28521.1 serine hydrolase [Shewanella sp. 10N.286.52.C2]PMG43261.1 serine hydrolase [Shewanella sp. 10N.286.52.B9]
MFSKSAFIVGTLSLAISTVLVSKPTHASIYNGVSDKFKQKFHQQLKKNKVPGGAFVIVEGDKILKLSYYGKRSKGSALNVNANTVFRLASVSKTFAGTLASMLVQENKLDWQQPINAYLPSFVLADPKASQKINLGHIIGQSTGLMPNSYDNLVNANVSKDKILNKFSEITPMCRPGVCYSYQNVAFSFIESAIEQKSGLSYENYIEKRIFKPLEMNNASTGYTAFMAEKNRAEPHIKTKSGFKKVSVKPNYYELAPAAGVNASITDMSKWLIANLGEKPAVLSSAVINDVTTPGVKTTKELRRRDWRTYLDNAYYGKGWRVYEFEGRPLIYHAGWVAGYVAEISYSPELNIGMVMLLNGESRVIAKLSSAFWHDVFKQQN